MMLSCKETVEILASHRELSFRQKLELRAHLFMCKHCSAYAEQLRALAEQLKKNYLVLTRTEPDRVRDLEQHVLRNLQKLNGSSSE